MAMRVFGREGARPEARAASNRAVRRVRLVAFRVFRKVRAPKRSRHPAVRRVRLVAFRESSGGCAPRRRRSPKSAFSGV